MPLYLSFLQTYARPLLGATLAGIIAGLGFMLLQPRVFDVSLELDITRMQQESDEYYQYDGFYTLRASNKFADIVKGWFQTPSVVTNILRQTENTPSPDSIPDLRNVFQSEKISAGTVEVRWTTPSVKTGEATAQVIEEVVQSKLNTESRSQYSIAVSDPVIERHQYNALFFGAAGAALGLFGGLIGTLLRELRKPRV